MFDAKQPRVYIFASGPIGTLYIDVTNNIYARMMAHKQGLRVLASTWQKS